MQGQIVGEVRGRRTSLDVIGDTLIWRGEDNVATTIHEIKRVELVFRRLDPFGAALLAIGLLVMLDTRWPGFVFAAIAIPLLVRRVVRPIPWLLLVVGDRRLLLRIDSASMALARALTDRIRQALATGEIPTTPPALP